MVASPEAAIFGPAYDEHLAKARASALKAAEALKRDRPLIRETTGFPTGNFPQDAATSRCGRSFRGHPQPAHRSRQDRSRRAAANESVALATRLDLAAEIARVTGGAVISQGNATAVLEKTARKSVLTTWKRREPVWTNPWLLLLLLSLVIGRMDPPPPQTVRPCRATQASHPHVGSTPPSPTTPARVRKSAAVCPVRKRRGRDFK